MSKQSGRIFQIFVALSEYLNFMQPNWWSNSTKKDRRGALFLQGIVGKQFYDFFQIFNIQ